MMIVLFYGEQVPSDVCANGVRAGLLYFSSCCSCRAKRNCERKINNVHVACEKSVNRQKPLPRLAMPSTSSPSVR